MSVKLFLKKHTIPVLIVALIGIVALGASMYFFIQYQNTQKLLQNPTLATQMQSKELVQKVGQLMELPTDENPTIATVSDITKLQDQPFFAHAKNGFKVLIYTQGKKAILYDPYENKIVEVAPVNLGQNQAPQQPQISPSKTSITPTPTPIKIVLYNGTKTVGLTKKIGPQITVKIPQVAIADTDNASRDDYAQTIVIDLSGKQSSIASQIATLLNGKVTTLPSGEKKPANVDILVILGKQ